ncbi:MAG: hypothetical protein ABJN42_24835 [Roseibium sp.]|uniref:hypothetical protein n=1 Tax=Roseibium sp. TaxID=1936156 RepID=UPI003299C770
MINASTRESIEKERRAKLARAEQASGYQEGGFVRNGTIVSVTVSFYPEEKWWIEPQGGTRERLTPEIWAECSKLKL